jgi:beta-mannosidase
VQTLNLNGKWVLMSEQGPTDVPAVVPGTVHLDLLREGHIPDPYFRDTEREVQWVGQRAWSYHRTFEVSAPLLDVPRVLLCFAGLDTLCTVIVNGSRVARTDNMHRRWEFEVKRHLRVGTNSIEVRFDPPLPYLKK